MANLVLNDCYELHLPEYFYTTEILSQWYKDIHTRIFITAQLFLLNSEKLETNIYQQKK